MSIGQVFNRGLDGLTVNARGLAVTSNNIANMNSAGYARQTIVIGAKAGAPGGGGGGAEVLAVEQMVSPFVEMQLFNTANDFGSVDGRRETMSQIESLYNDTQGGGLGKYLNDLFNSFQDLSSDPASIGVRTSVREKAIQLGNRFNSLSEKLNRLKTGLVAQMNTRIDTINSYASEIADLNRTIAQAADTSTVLDSISRRQFVLRQLSEEVNINYFSSDTGSIQVQIAGGATLVNEFESGELDLVDNASPGGTATVNLTMSGASSSIDVTARIAGGRLGANILDRNTTLNDQISDLDTLAYELMTQINTQHRAGFGLDGLDNRDFFLAPTAVAGAASNMELDPSILADVGAIAAAGSDPSSSPGDNANARLLGNLQNDLTMATGTQTFAQYYQGIVSTIGVQTASIERSYETQANLMSQMEQQREAVSGVNLDEEGANLIRFQKAFQANSRILAIADQMLDDLLRI